jgi:hypothetical protein
MTEIFHYCGHIISKEDTGRFPSSNEQNVSHSIQRYMQFIRPRDCYGALAAGADIMLAEKLVDKGASLHVVLPFEKERFVEMSITPSGKDWLERFNNLYEQAQTVAIVYSKKPENEIVSYALCTIVASGLSIYQTIKIVIDENRITLQKPRQIAIWDQQQTDGFAGTYADMVRWQAFAFKTDYISSKKPFVIKEFTNPNNHHYNGFNIVIYHKNHNHKSHHVNNISELMNALESEPYGAQYFVDLDHNIFGSLTVHGAVNISMRALGLIIYHCYAKNGVSECKRLLYKLNLCLESNQ